MPSNQHQAAEFMKSLQDITKKTVTYLKGKNVTADRIIQAFPLLPKEQRQKYYFYLREKMLKGERSILDLQDPSMHFGLLKVSVDAFGNPELQAEIEKLSTDILKLRKSVTAEKFLEKSRNTGSLPATHKEIELSVNKEPTACTLEDIENIRRDFVSEFMPKVSEVLVYLHQIRQGSSKLVWGAPREESKNVKELLLQDNDRSFYQRYDISTCSVGKEETYKKGK